MRVSPQYLPFKRWLLVMAAVQNVLCGSSLASSIRYSVQHLQNSYGNDLLFTKMAKDGTLTASALNPARTYDHVVAVVDGVRKDVYPPSGMGVSTAFDRNGEAYGVRRPGGTLAGIAKINTDGGVTNLSYTPQGTSLSLYGFNRVGTLVGQESPLPTTGGNLSTGGFIYDPVNGGRTVQQLGGVRSVGFDAVNDAGYLVGYGLNAANRGNLFLWRDGEPAISLVQTNDGSANAINEAAQVVGIANGSAFLWDRGSLTRPASKLVEDPAHLGTFNEVVTFSGAYDISEDGMIVGTAEVRTVPGFTAPLHGQKGWVWTAEGGLVWLDDLIDPALGFQLTSGVNISDNGQILARGYVAGSNVVQNFLITPIPESGTTALLLAGVVLCYRRRR